MSNPSLALAEMMLQDVSPRRAFRGKAVAVLSMVPLLAFCCAALWSQAAVQPVPAQDPAISLAWQRMVDSARATRARMDMKPIPARSALPIESSMQHLALTAIKAASTRDHRAARDIVMKAEASMDEGSKEKVAEMAKATKLKVEDMPGALAPLGFWDPLGFATDQPEGKILFYREVELKHGRVGMLASLGFLVGENFHPLFGGNIDVPAYIAFQQTPLQTFWGAVVAAIAIPEVFSVFTFNSPFGGPEVGYAIKDGWSIRSDRVPGDFNFDPLGLKPQDPKEFKEMQNKEINNGRLGMLAAAGMIAQELATGQKLFP
jgi:hypothetical protein